MTIDAQGFYGADANSAMLAPKGILGKSDGLAALTNARGENNTISWANTALSSKNWVQFGTTLTLNKGRFLIIVSNNLSASAGSSFDGQPSLRLNVNGTAGNVYGDNFTQGTWPQANQTVFGGFIISPLTVASDSTTVKVEGTISIIGGTIAAYGSLNWIRIG